MIKKTDRSKARPYTRRTGRLDIEMSPDSHTIFQNDTFKGQCVHYSSDGAWPQRIALSQVLVTQAIKIYGPNEMPEQLEKTKHFSWEWQPALNCDCSY